MSRRGGGSRVAEYEEQDYYRREPAREAFRDPPPVQTRTREYEEVDTYQRRGPETNRPEFMRDDYRRPDPGPLVLRERETETYTRPVERRSPSPARSIRPRYVERSPSPPRVERERSRVRTRIIERSPSPPPVERVRTRVVERERRSPSPPPVERIRTRYVERERSPSPPIEFRRTKIVERERERSPSPDRSQLRMRVVERTERTREPSPEPLPPPPPIFIEKPPIHQEIITHHRHIDHGFERAPAPTPPPPPPAPAPRRRERDETEIDISTSRGQTNIEIYKNGSNSKQRRRGDTLEVYDDDIIFERERDTQRTRTNETRLSRRRSLSSRPRETSISIREERGERGVERAERSEIDREAEYYNRRAEERGYVGEAWNGATKDWAIVDVPPGTERVRMDGIGGGSQEITWQRYNGVRRSRFIPEREREREPVESRELEIRDSRGGGASYEYEREEITDRTVALPRERRKERDMWTEITKDLVVREAIEQLGYDFEETEYFYYIIQYLRFEDVQELVQLSDQIRRERQRRMRELQWEREMLEERREREREREREIEERRKWERREPYEDERIIEREIIYDGRRGGGREREYLR